MSRWHVRVRAARRHPPAVRRPRRRGVARRGDQRTAPRQGAGGSSTGPGVSPASRGVRSHDSRYVHGPARSGLEIGSWSPAPVRFGRRNKRNDVKLIARPRRRVIGRPRGCPPCTEPCFPYVNVYRSRVVATSRDGGSGVDERAQSNNDQGSSHIRDLRSSHGTQPSSTTESHADRAPTRRTPTRPPGGAARVR